MVKLHLANSDNSILVDPSDISTMSEVQGRNRGGGYAEHVQIAMKSGAIAPFYVTESLSEIQVLIKKDLKND